MRNEDIAGFQIGVDQMKWWREDGDVWQVGTIFLQNVKHFWTIYQVQEEGVI